MLTPEDWRAVQNGAGKLYRLPFWVDDQSRSINQIAAKLRKWHAVEVSGKKENPEALALGVVDYLQLVKSEGRRNDNRDTELSRVGAELKELAESLKIPIVCVCAMSRAQEKRGGRPILSDLRECGALEYHANVVIFVYRDIPPDEPKRRRESGPGELIVGKNRGGETDVADVYWNAPLMEWAPLDSHHEPPPSHHDRD
jgi:replicative DNA helicase